MVKVANNAVDKELKSLSPAATCLLVYGPDEGLVRERADIISKQIVSDLADPFNVVKPELKSLSDEPSLLADELLSLSMLGDRRLIRLDGAGATALKACELAIEVEKTDNILLVTAGALNTKSKLRKLFEKSKNALAIACYTDNIRDIEGLIFQILSTYGLRAEPAAISYLTSILGNDRLVTRGEIEKLATYLANSQTKEVTLKDAKAVVGDNNALTLNEIANAVASGQPQRLDNLLERATNQGENPIAILRVLQKHLQKLHFIKGFIDQGDSTDNAMNNLYPRLFFKDKDSFKAQLFKWSTDNLAKALAMCQQAESECKTTGMPDQAICARICLNLSVRAAQNR